MQVKSRESHTKSRNGCRSCKKRRIKCDEQGPPCANCTSRKTDCMYDKARPARPSPISVKSPLTRPSNLPKQQTQHHVRDLLELELLHQWTTQTYKTVSAPKDYEEWLINVPQYGFEQYEFLLDGIFALSAMHIAETSKKNSSERVRYIQAALTYTDRFCITFQTNLRSMSPEKLGPMFPAAVMMIVLGLRPPQLSNDHSSYFERLLSVVVLVHGAVSIALDIRGLSRPPIFTSEEMTRYFEPRELDSDVAHMLHNLSSICDRLEEPVRAIHQATIESLTEWWKRAYHGDFRSAFMSLLTCRREFFEHVRSEHPESLLVLLLWAVHFEEVCRNSLFWLRSVGKMLVLEIAAKLQPLSTEAPKWQEMILWAKAKVQASASPPD